ncbi:Lactation elevated protein 1 [Hordeum vulgare]|nr:Lactation elevated protein 1 [Hordeum vulgare]
MTAKYPNRTLRIFRYLQGHRDAIKVVCSRWLACLEQVRNSPPSSTVESDYEEIAQERYNDMEASCARSFNLEHFWKLLQHSQKWELIEKKSPSKRSSLIEMDDDDDGPRNKNKPDGNKKAKDKIKREFEASSLRDKIDIMVQSNEVLVINTLETKELVEKEAQEKQEKWLLLHDEGLGKAAIEERKDLAEENRALASFLRRRTRS